MCMRAYADLLLCGSQEHDILCVALSQKYTVNTDGTRADLAKMSPFVLQPETFALHVGGFLLARYAHLSRAFVDVEVLRWQRIELPVEGQDGKAHGHAFWRDGEEKRVVKAEVVKKGGVLEATVKAGLVDLLVIKTTGSAFENFVRDEFTTLVEVSDRIFSTAVDLEYTFTGPVVLLTAEGKVTEASLENVKNEKEFDAVARRARAITLETFAEDESASVQATLYKMGVQLVEEHVQIEEVRYALPNKHYVPVDMKYIGVDNTTPSCAEVFCALSSPSGLIRAVVGRGKK